MWIASAYSRMAISHALPLEPIDVRPLGARLSGEKSVALFKSEDLEVMRTVLLAGKSVPAHKVAGEVTIHCLEGKLDVTTEGASHVLTAGQLLYLPRDLPHGVVALEDASALVTIVLRS